MTNDPQTYYEILTPVSPTPTSIALSPDPPAPADIISPEAHEPPSLAQLFASIQPPVDEGTLKILRQGLRQREAPPTVPFPHLTTADMTNFKFILSLREVLISLLHVRAEDPDDKGGDDWFYELMGGFTTAEEKMREYWDQQNLLLPKPLDVFMRFKRAVMSPPGCTFVEEVVKTTDWPFLIMGYLHPPARRWVEERFPSLKGGKGVVWETFLRVLQAGFEGNAIKREPAEAAERPKLDGLEYARRVAEGVLEEAWWDSDPERRYAINIEIN
jgi:hypothetical protein